MAGIIGYGAYIPNYRLKVEEIWETWMNHIDPPHIMKERRGLTEKAFGRWDEDTVTMAIVAAKASLEMAGISGDDINGIFFGTCTNPYASKASSLAIAEALTANRELFCTDLQFSVKSGTVALQTASAAIDAGQAEIMLAIGADNLSRHVPPNDNLEYSASAGAAAFVMGKTKTIADIETLYNYNIHNPEFFRLDGERYIKHAASEDGEYLWGYKEYIKKAVDSYLKKFACNLGDFQYVAISEPDGFLPVFIAREIGISDRQIEASSLAREVGDFGSASPLMGLQSVLDIAKANERVLVISYGFGAGCDVMSLKTKPALIRTRKKREAFASIREMINKKEYPGYAQFLRQERKLIQEYL